MGGNLLKAIKSPLNSQPRRSHLSGLRISRSLRMVRKWPSGHMFLQVM